MNGRFWGPWRAVALAALLLVPTSSSTSAENPTAAPLNAGLTGVTIDSLGRVLDGVEIRLQPVELAQGSKLRAAQSDKQGRFLFGDLPPGQYRLVAVKGGYSVVVGSVNTVLQNSIDLILRPAGSAPAGAHPSDGAWSLRLASRDRLEDRGYSFGSGPPADPPGESMGDAPLQFDVATSQLGNGNSTDIAQSPGLRAGGRGALAVGERGRIDLGYSYMAEGNREQRYDRGDAVQAEYRGGAWTVSFDADRLERTRLPVEEAVATLASLTEHALVDSNWQRRGENGILSVRAGAAFVRGMQDDDSIAFSGALPPHEYESNRVDLDLAHQREWGGHRSTVSATMRSAAGAISSGGKMVLLAAAAEPSYSALGSIDGSSLEIALEDEWSAHSARKTALISRVRFEGATERGIESLRGAGSFGALWQLPMGVELLVEGGVGVDAYHDSRGLWNAALTGSSSRFQWQIAHTREMGLSPFGDSVGLHASPDSSFAWGSPLATDRDGEIERLAIGASWIPRGGPQLALRGEQFELSGRLAANLPDDLPIVAIVQQGRGSGQAIDLQIDSDRTGTRVDMRWTIVDDDAQGRVLLAGADQWEKREVNFRQRLGERGFPGASWQLIVGLEQGLVSTPEEAVSARLALLSESRVSGGFALAF